MHFQLIFSDVFSMLGKLHVAIKYLQVVQYNTVHVNTNTSQVKNTELLRYKV